MSQYLAHYGTKGSKWGYNKGKRNGKRTASEDTDEQLTKKAIDAQTKKPGEAQRGIRVAASMNEAVRRQLSTQRMSRAAAQEVTRKANKIRKAANAAIKAVGRNRVSQGNDAADIRQARSVARAATSEKKRKANNRKLNRIDGVNAKQGAAARRQIYSYYNRRLRKNLKNA